MPDFTLPNTPFPNGTTVRAYDATGYASFPGMPPGQVAAEGVVADGSVTLEGLTDRTPYFAVAEVAGEWRSVHFIVGEDASSVPVATEVLSSGVLIAPRRGEKLNLTTQAELDAMTLDGLADVSAGGPTVGALIAFMNDKWSLMSAPRISPEMFGAKGDSNGSAGSGTDDTKAVQDAANLAAAIGAVFFHESFYRTTATVEVVTDTFKADGIGTTKCGLVPDSSAYDALVVGPGAGGSGTRDTGYAYGFDIRGGNANVLKAGAGPDTGKAAFKLNGMRNFKVGIRVAGSHDIAFDQINNCYGTTYFGASAAFGSCRIFSNLRKGTENGEDITYIDCWGSGEVATLHVTSGKNYRVIGGQLSASRQATTPEDERGVVILGKDYLGLAGAEDAEITLETSLEYFQQCWAIRAFKQVNISGHFSVNAGGDTAKALGFYKNAAHGNTVVSLDRIGFGGSEFSKPAAELVVRTGSNSGSMWDERGSWGSYSDGTGSTNALWNNMARRAEVPRSFGHRDGNIVMAGAFEYRDSGGVMQVSALHKEEWKSLISTAGAITSDGKLTAKGEIEVDGDLNHDGEKVGLYGVTPVTRPTALTAANAETVDATYGTPEANVINNLRTRVNELETKLKALGLLS